MGAEKALLRLPDGRSALAAVVDAVRASTESVYLAAGSREQGERLLASLAALRPTLLIDEQPGEGPLAALALALRRVEVDGLLLLPVDAPLLQPALVHLLNDRFAAADVDAVLPEADGWARPLPAVYGRTLLPCAEALLAAGRRDLRALAGCAGMRVELVGEDMLRAADPQLLSLRNANTPEEWQALLTLAAGDAPPL
jgi:molybdopterin-guanine dinucleotide biosynthesis protein A